MHTGEGSEQQRVMKQIAIHFNTTIHYRNK